MKYLLRLTFYLILLFLTFSVVSVLLLRFVPIGFTPLKVIALRENGKTERDFPFRSRWVSLDRISPELMTAVVATEDNHFLNHHGFDFKALRKAFEENREGGRLRGASTISQQTAKNVFCFPQRTWFRKAVESWFTVWIELVWGKRRIMEVYLNVIETHPNIYGAEATARRFYQKAALNLNRHEAAMIATVLPNPRRMNLAAPSAYMVRRAAQVRRLMTQIGPVSFDRPLPPSKRKKTEK